AQLWAVARSKRAPAGSVAYAREVNDGADGSFELGVPGPMRDRLVAAVLAGEKVATSALLVQYEDEGEPLPTAGEHRVVLGSADEHVAVVELLEVAVIRLGDADEALARDEGEGFRTAGQWRNAHEAFWRSEVLPHLARRIEL